MRYIYLLKDPISKTTVYVGETANPKQRYNQHCWGLSDDSKDKSQWLGGLKALGLKPLFEIIETAETKRGALIKENYLIVSYLKIGIKLFNQINTTTIKQYELSGKLIGEYANAKIAKDLTGILPKMNRYTTAGFHWSYGEFDENFLNKKYSAKRILCKPVLQIDKSGKIVNEFEGVRIACEKTGIDHRSISQVATCSTVRKSAGGYLWKYKTDNHVS